MAACIAASGAGRGEVQVGRKLGFTNPAVQAQFGIDGPVWSRLFARTVHDIAAIGGSFDLTVCRSRASSRSSCSDSRRRRAAERRR